MRHRVGPRPKRPKPSESQRPCESTSKYSDRLLDRQQSARTPGPCVGKTGSGGRPGPCRTAQSWLSGPPFRNSSVPRPAVVQVGPSPPEDFPVPGEKRRRPVPRECHGATRSPPRTKPRTRDGLKLPHRVTPLPPLEPRLGPPAPSHEDNRHRYRKESESRRSLLVFWPGGRPSAAEIRPPAPAVSYGSAGSRRGRRPGLHFAVGV